jgi:hypothetical protein
VAEPEFAVVDILCPVNALPQLQTIANLRVEFLPERTDDPDVALLHAFADEDAQSAARDLGCTVTVAMTPQQYAEQLDAAYGSLSDDDGGGVG